MKHPTPDFLKILSALCEYKVDFIIVGGVCAVLHGAPVATFDLDLVHSRSPDNLERLMSALKKLGAYYRGRGEQRFAPRLSDISSTGHQLLLTKFGPLDLLGTIGVGHDYEDLLKHCVKIEVNELWLNALDLQTLIEVKNETISVKDKAIIPILKRTLEEKRKC